MTVYSKKATIKIQPEDRRNPTREIELYLTTERFKGIDCIILKNKGFQNEIDVEFICSDVNPSYGRSAEDINELMNRLKIVKEPKEHVNDPLKANDHLMDIVTNLDNPNINDKLISKAKEVHDEKMTKERIKLINRDFEDHNKRLSETSTDNSDRLKSMDERKTTSKVGQIERA